jgi:hypothetical protein
MRVGLAVAGLIVVGSFALAVRSRLDWNRYMREHHCRPSGHIYTRYGRQTVYRCDGNEMIVRH